MYCDMSGNEIETIRGQFERSSRIEVELALESEPEWIRGADELGTEAVPRKAYSLGMRGVEWLSEREKCSIVFSLSFFLEVLLPSTTSVQEAFPFRKIFFYTESSYIIW